jgi:hypothetical protein
MHKTRSIRAAGIKMADARDGAGPGDTQRRSWAEREDQLLSTQKAGLKIILQSCVDTISLNLASDVHSDEDQRTVWTPHEVFCIDGGRGSGKTFTLSSLPHALDALSDRYLKDAGVREQKYLNWKTLLGEITGWPKRGGNDGVSGRSPSGDELIESGVSRFKEMDEDRQPPKELAHVLRIIFPGDMEGGESVMEAFFAALLQEIQEIEKATKDESKKQEYENLKKELRAVAEGFYFAKRFGVDAIIRDSVDYPDLVAQFETQSNKSSYRTRAWRNFIYHYLKSRKFPVLVILLDDSDVEADLTRDILHAIRMFLCHPRIITVLAGNTRSMRDSLVHYGMRRLGASIAALDRGNQRTAQDWRQAMRKDAEYYLEKVLPQERRVFIGPPELSFAVAPRTKPGLGDGAEEADGFARPGGSTDSRSDFRKIALDDFSAIIRERVDAARERFLPAKFRLAVEYENNRSDAPNRSQRRHIEEFLAWWIFANRYAGPLAPRSARQIRTFRTYYVDPGKRTKRLPVMLHDIPENYTLIQRLGDEDFSLVPWLWQQELRSEWTGQRCFRINGRAVYQGTYTFNYIRYRLDLNLAMPMRKNSEESVPAGLLPTLRGRRYMRRFFQPVNMPRQQRRVGLVRWIDHAALPGNCFYFYDLATLPDLGLIPNDRETQRMGSTKALDEELSRGKWEAGLAGRWMELLAEEQKEKLIRYLTWVTFERLRGTEGTESTRLISILDQEDNNYENFLDLEIQSFEWSPDVWDRAKKALRTRPEGTPPIEKSSEQGEREKSAQKIIARHAALITDLRRAWHAIRIHEAAPSRPMESGETAGALQEMERTANEVIANQGRMALYTRQDIEKLFRSSPWVAELLSRLNLDAGKAAHHVGDLTLAIKNESTIAGIEKDISIGKLHKPEDKEIRSEIAAEEKDYQEWTIILRALGRAICMDWPVSDGTKIAYKKDLERDLLNAIMLDVSQDERSDQQQQYGREARNFVLLLYGLAPSFSAIVHTQLMAELLHFKFRKVGDDEVRGSLTRELTAWAAFIGTLSVSLRYVKIKFMHLFAKLFIKSMFDDVNGAIMQFSKTVDKTDTPQQAIKKLSEEQLATAREDAAPAVEFLRQCGIHFNKIEPTRQWLSLLQNSIHELRQLFGETISENLAIMPDVAPSTLFGDKWMVELVQHGGIRNALIRELPESASSAEKDVSEFFEDPLDVRGIFSETEQWLWATSRCLRKWHGVIETKHFGFATANSTATPAS